MLNDRANSFSAVLHGSQKTDALLPFKERHSSSVLLPCTINGEARFMVYLALSLYLVLRHFHVLAHLNNIVRLCNGTATRSVSYNDAT